MQDIALALAGALLLAPLQTQLADRLAGVRAPLALVAEAERCVRAAGPAVADRALADPWWATRAAVGLWTGWSDPCAILADVAPTCARAIDAVRPPPGQRAW